MFFYMYINYIISYYDNHNNCQQHIQGGLTANRSKYGLNSLCPNFVQNLCCFTYNDFLYYNIN
jgi:hypothetical protein